MNYSQKFLDAFDYVMKYEGGLNEDPDDRGGITNFGISIKFLKGTGDKYCKDGKYLQYLHELTIDQAKEIYHAEFWLEVYELVEIDLFREYIFDMVINHGRDIAHKLLQRGLWAAGDRRIKDDGIFGKETLQSLNSSYISSIAVPAYFSLRAIRTQYYHCIVSHHPEQEKFLEGWLRRAYGI